MVSFTGFLLIYIAGGLTFLPLVLLFAFIYNKGGIEPLLPRPKVKEEEYVYKDPDMEIVKKGWIRITNQYQPKMPEHNVTNGIISGIHSYVSKEQHKKGLVYAVLKHGSLFCFDSEKQQEVIMILPMQDFNVSLYPPSKPDTPEGLLYGRTVVVRLVPKNIKKHDDNEKTNPSVCTLPEEDITVNPNRVLYLTCARSIDKEDWYLGLIQAQHVLIDSEQEKVQYVMMDNTHFDHATMEELIHQVQSSPSQRETAWLNAVFGRLFLAMYKTERLKELVETKIRKKIDKTKRPTFLDEITVRKVDIGGSIPFITDPKLLSLSPQGEVIVEAKVEYHGGLMIEIETDFNWSYSSLMKPIRMHLVLSVNLKKLSGRMMFKLKAPPTNRIWLGFFEMPEMEWKITPIVADKQIKLSVVTNAIESRIREVMTETFVLPNMNDTSFCHSDGKGGIFGEYVKVKKEGKSKAKGYVHKDEKIEMKHSRENSTSSEQSNIRETPTVPEIVEKPVAADVLKLPSRHAESATDLAITGTTKKDLTPNAYQVLETSYSTPDMQVSPLPSTSDDNRSVKSVDQQINSESTHTTSNSNKWSNTSSYLRKRMNKSTEEDNSDSDSIKSNKTNSSTGSGFLNKISNLLPADSLPTTSDATSVKSTSSTSNNNNKKGSLIHRAENFLAKKTGHHEELLNEEKKGIYAERLANMRKRAEEKIASFSSNMIPPPLPSKSSVEKSTHLLDNETPESDVFKALPPRRERSSSAVHGEKSSLLSKPIHLQPPLPPRRNSTPIPVSDELLNTSVQEVPQNNTLLKAVITEEPEVTSSYGNHDDLPEIPIRPPLPTTPRPVLSPTFSHTPKPDLPSRDTPPVVPPRHS